MVKRPTRPITRVSNSNSLISTTPFYIGLSKRRGYVNRKFSLPEERPATYPPFMADSRGETPQGYCSGYGDRFQRSYVSLRCLLPSRLPAQESYRKPALWSSLPSGSILLYPPPGLACWREKLCASHPLVSPAGSVGSRQSATGARSPPPVRIESLSLNLFRTGGGRFYIV